MSVAYQNCLEEMFGLRRFGIKLGLSCIRDMLAGLGNPQERFASIHVAGTNGKGSIASGLAAVLSAAGYTAGLYTSPHLVRFNERIRIGDRLITDEEVVACYQTVKRAYSGGREPTFFEFTTAMALYEFGRRNVDWAVIETGMGGRLDATNILVPRLAIITNIAREHQEYLGRTIASIAAEKGGIIKPGIPVITGVRQKSALDVMENLARENRAPLFRLGKEFKVRRNPDGTFNYYGVGNSWRNLHTGLQGSYQVDNAALVVAACEILEREKRVSLNIKAISEGLLKNKWPGRLEVVSRSPFVLVDGAHNLMAARNLARFLKENFPGRPITLVAGILDDKPFKEMLSVLLPLCRKAILTRPRIDRGLPPERLLQVARHFLPAAVMVPDVAGAVTHALSHASKDEVICIAGSLYVVGEAKEFFNTRHVLG